MNMTLRSVSVWGLISLMLAIPAARSAQAADVPGLPTVEQLAGYVKGENEDAVRAVDALIRAGAPETLPVIEERLISVVQSPEATLDAFRHACRQLKMVGGERTAEALAPGLLAEKVSHYVRYALEGNPSSVVDAALLSALQETSGDLRLGMISSLAARRNEEAVRPLAEMAASDNAALAEAALKALGRIGTLPAAQALSALRLGEDLHLWRADSLLRCADRMSVDGTEAGVAIYAFLLRDPVSPAIRIAALIGIARADAERALPHVLEQLTSESWPMRAAAGGSLAKYLPGASVTRAIGERMATLPPETQEVVINALAARNDEAVPAVVNQALESEHIPVRQAAIEALGIVGDASAIPRLVDFVLAGGDSGSTARASLAALRGDDVSTAIHALIDSPEAEVRALAANTMLARGERVAAPRIAAKLSDGDARVRTAASRALADLGAMTEFRAVIEHLEGAEDAAERRGLSRAASGILDRSEQTAPAMPLLAAALSQTGAEVQEELIPILRFVGSTEALNATKPFLRSGELSLRRAAILAMSEWPTDEAMVDLLRAAKEDENPGNRVLALRGYVQATGRSGMSAEEKSRLFNDVLEMAPSVDIIRLVLSSMLANPSPQSLSVVEAYLTHEEVSPEARITYIGMAERLRRSHPEEARSAAQTLTGKTDDEALLRRAKALLQ